VNNEKEVLYFLFIVHNISTFKYCFCFHCCKHCE